MRVAIKEKVMATRIDTMIQRLAEVRATGLHDDPDTVAVDTMPSWVRGMVKEGWIAERVRRDEFGDTHEWRLTPEWHAIEQARRKVSQPTGRPRQAKVRVVSFALLCPACSAELARCDEAQWPQAPHVECACGARVGVPHRAIEALYA